MEALRTTLAHALARPHQFSFNVLKVSPDNPVWNPGPLEHPEPAPDAAPFRPAALTGLAALKPGAKRRHEEAVTAADAQYHKALAEHAEREATRQAQLRDARAKFDAEVEALRAATAQRHAAVTSSRPDSRVAIPTP
ncbi:MAG: hypothetical protein ACLP22_15120 [Solirubrobacteraceae bacterium]